MAVYNDAVLTDAGRRLVYDAIAAEKSIMFTRIAIGNGSYTVAEKSPERLVTRTALKAAVQDYEISYMRRASDTNIRLGTIITNYDPDTHDPLIANDTYLNEIGIMAKGEDDETDVLYGIAVCRDERGDLIPGYNGTNPIEIIQDFSAYINSNAEVTLEYPETAYARATDLADTQAELEDTEDLLAASREIIEDNLAPAYDDQTSYVAGDWCIYEHVLYRCSGAATGDFDSTKWDAVPVGSELKTIKKSVSDGKAVVAGAITEMNVPTAADASFQTMADNIGEILDENPGVISAGTNARSLSDNTSDSFNIPIEFNVRTAGYHKSGNDPVGTRSGETEYIRLYNRDDKVTAEIQYDVMQPNRKLGEVAKTAGTITATVGTTSGTADTATLTPSFTINTAGQHSSSVGTRTATSKTLSLLNNGANMDLKDGNTVIARAAKSTGSVSSTVSATAGTSSTISLSAPMTFTAGHIASKGTEGTKSLSVVNNGANVDVKDGNTVVGRVAKSTGSVTATVSTTAGTSSSVSVSPSMSLTAGYIASKGTETAKTLTLANNGANVELKDGSTVIGKVAKSTGSVSSSASFNSGTSTTVTAKSAMSLTAGHISSKGTEGTATAYLRKSGNYVYLSSSSSGGTNYGRYTIPTQTKTADNPSIKSTRTVSPDSGYLLSSVTVPKFRNAIKDPWSIGGTGTRYTNGAKNYAYGMGDSMAYKLTSGGKYLYNGPFYPNETSDFLMLFLHIKFTSSTNDPVYFCVCPSSAKETLSTTGVYKFTTFQYNSSYSEFTGYLLVPIGTSYEAGDVNYGGKDWYGNGRSNISEVYVKVYTSTTFNGVLDVYGIGAKA